MSRLLKSRLKKTVTWLLFSLCSSCSENVIVDDVGNTTDPPVETVVDVETETETGSASMSPCGDDPQAPTEPRLADVIVVVDNSPKMETEISMTQKALGELWSTLEAAGTKPHLTVISAANPGADPKDKNGVCIPEPLGSGTCPEDSRPPGYVHLPVQVGSKDALLVLHGNYDSWKERIRRGGDLHILVISDDDSEMTAQEFIEAMSSSTPSVEKFFFHSIAAATDKIADCALEPPGPCCEVSSHLAAVYKELVQMTGGVFGDLCRQDFASEFSAIAKNIAQTSCRSSLR